ncbi:type II toxin-antitoxin system Phd/YefM family antitoxin [Rhizobium sp. LEGMi198b]
METVNIHEAKTHLSRLIEKAAKGEAFIIAKAGKPMVKVVPLEEKEAPKKRRIGFMKGEIVVPEDFDTMMSTEIEEMFRGNLNDFKSIRDR